MLHVLGYSEEVRRNEGAAVGLISVGVLLLALRQWLHIKKFGRG